MTLGGWLGGRLFLFLFLLLLSFGLYTRSANSQCLKSHNWSFSRTQGVHSIWSVVLRPNKASWDAKVCKRSTTILTLREMACFTRIPSLQDQSMMNWKKTCNCNYKLHGIHRIGSWWSFGNNVLPIQFPIVSDSGSTFGPRSGPIPNLQMSETGSEKQIKLNDHFNSGSVSVKSA